MIGKKEYFLQIAEVTAKRSKDPSTKLGAVIVNSNDQIVGTGYNGFIAKCNEGEMSFDRPLKYHLTIHAEINAVFSALKNFSKIEDSTLYCTDAPCENCLKHILQVGIRKIVYKSARLMKERSDENQREAIKRLINSTGASVTSEEEKDYLSELFE